ncbi:LamG domain-containing protein [Candidatus Poribacteria bacterium]|nr:LamG domain-containing protein [Candidatus Poribacteria bacterium]
MKRLLFTLFSISLVFVGLTAYPYEKKDILLYYSFDKLDGGKVKDQSGNGHDAELIGKGDLVDGKFNKAIRLNGGIVQMNKRNVIESVGDTGELTMEQWMFLNDHNSYDGIISIEAPEGDCCEFRTMVDPGFHPFWDAGHHVDKSLPNFTFDVKKWYHYVLVADGKVGKVYINGKAIGEQPENFKLPKFKEVTIYIGAGENPNVHKVEDAIIDEVALYNKALNEKEINESMNKGIPGVLAVEPQGKLAVTWGKIKSNF